MDQGIVGVVDQPVGGVVDARILDALGVQCAVAPVLPLGEQVVKAGPLGKAEKDVGFAFQLQGKEVRFAGAEPHFKLSVHCRASSHMVYPAQRRISRMALMARFGLE